MNATVRWVAAFGAGTALLSAAVIYKIKAGDGDLDVHTEQKIDFREAAAPEPAAEVGDPKRSAQQHYLSAIIFIQKGDLAKAADELKLAAKLDPHDKEIAEALRRYGNPVSSVKKPAWEEIGKSRPLKPGINH